MRTKYIKRSALAVLVLAVAGAVFFYWRVAPLPKASPAEASCRNLAARSRRIEFLQRTRAVLHDTLYQYVGLQRLETRHQADNEKEFKALLNSGYLVEVPISIKTDNGSLLQAARSLKQALPPDTYWTIHINMAENTTRLVCRPDYAELGRKALAEESGSVSAVRDLQAGPTGKN